MEPRLDWQSASSFVVADPRWRSKILRGGLLLLFPPLGWPAALGYRKVLIAHLKDGRTPLLPEWKGKTFHYWIEGMRALGVIFSYYTPILLFLLLRLTTRELPGDFPWLGLLFGFSFFFMLTPFLMPLIIGLLSDWVGHDVFSGTEVVCVLAYFGLATFFIPAGFLQVSRTGSYLSALRPLPALRFIRRNFRNYVEAWIYSSLTSLVGHMCFPLSPWGIFWCYQSIVYSFNEIRMHSEDEEDRELQSSHSWYKVFGGPDFWARYEREERRFFESYRPRSAGDVLTGEPSFDVFRLGSIRAPLPHGIARWLAH